MIVSFRAPSWVRAARVAALVLAAGSIAACGSGSVDPALVGVWEIPVPGGGAWRLTIDEDGRYVFTNDGVGTAESHSGEFNARGGEWSLVGADGGIEDRGTYEVVAGALALTGNRGMLRWAAAREPVAAPAATPAFANEAGPAPQSSAPAPSAAATGAASAAASRAAPASTLPEIIDPCALVTADEASNLLGVPVETKRTTPQPSTQNDCYYSGSGRTLSVRSYNGRGLDVAGYLARQRDSGGELLPGVGDGAYLHYRQATGLTSVELVVDYANVEMLATGIARERADPGLRQLAAQAAGRMRTPAAAFRVPGTAGFAGTWLVRSTNRGGMRSPDMMFTVEASGALRIVTTGGASGALVLDGDRWRVDDPLNSRLFAGTYRLRGDRLTLGGDAVSAELTRVACGQEPQRVRPAYALVRDIGGMLSGARNGPPPAPASFDRKLAGLWEGEGKLNGAASQFLVSIDDRSSTVLAAFPFMPGRLQASESEFTLAIEGFGESKGTYRFAGGINDGTIRMEDGDTTLEWVPYDPGARPRFAEPITARCY